MDGMNGMNDKWIDLEVGYSQVDRNMDGWLDEEGGIEKSIGQG